MGTGKQPDIAIKGTGNERFTGWTCMEVCGQAEPCGNRFCSAYRKPAEEPKTTGRQRKPFWWRR